MRSSQESGRLAQKYKMYFFSLRERTMMPLEYNKTDLMYLKIDHIHHSTGQGVRTK